MKKPNEKSSIQFTFSANFDWSPPEKRSVVIAFKAGRAYPVRRACAQAAINAGKGAYVNGDTPAAETVAADEPVVAAEDAAG